MEPHTDSTDLPDARLQAMLAEMAAMETALAADARPLGRLIDGSAAAHQVANDIAAMALAHGVALEKRRCDLGIASPPMGAADGQTAHRHSTDEPGPPSSVLRHLFTRLQEAVIGYAALQAVATRSRDSWVVAAEGTAAHLARQYTQEYLRAAGRITQLLHDAVIAELDAAGLPCCCTCPGCGSGICLCAVGGRTILGEAWAAARPVPFDGGIEVQHPRPGSPAERAGLRKGDVVVKASGKAVDTAAVLITAIKHAESGQLLHLAVRRGRREIRVAVPLEEEPVHLQNLVSNEDDCIRPSGPEFHRSRSRDLKDSFRRLSESSPLGGFGTLSPREIEVVRQIAEGATNLMIAERLHVSRPTVARQVAQVLRKLELSNRTEVAAAAAALGLLAEG